MGKGRGDISLQFSTASYLKYLSRAWEVNKDKIKGNIGITVLQIGG